MSPLAIYSPESPATAWPRRRCPVFTPTPLDRGQTAAPTITVAPSTIGTARVLHVINGEHYSGAERVQDLLARQLPQFGYEIGFACVRPVLFPSSRETKSAPLVEMPMAGRFDLGVVKKLARLIRDNDYQLVHAHTPRTSLVGRLAARKPACRSSTTSTARPAATRRDG